MSGRALPVLGVLIAVTVVLVLAGLLVIPSPIPAQQPAPKPPAELPEGYVGSETCKGCHEEAWQRFSHTKMGRLFLKQPRNSLEGLACENCHGPGKAHVEAGGGKGVGGLITFART